MFQCICILGIDKRIEAKKLLLTRWCSDRIEHLGGMGLFCTCVSSYVGIAYIQITQYSCTLNFFFVAASIP